MFKLFLGDITMLAVDAIVNAANSSLLGGKGVDGAIHKKAGPGLLAECRELKVVNNSFGYKERCQVGNAVITNGYLLPAKKVIHTVGPIWNLDAPTEAINIAFLRSCYLDSLRLAVENNLKQIAFPCISTGAYQFPRKLAAEIAIDACREIYGVYDIEIIFCCFLKEDYEIYETLLQNQNFEKERFTYKLNEDNFEVFDNDEYLCSCATEYNVKFIVECLKYSESVIVDEDEDDEDEDLPRKKRTPILDEDDDYDGQ